MRVSSAVFFWEICAGAALSHPEYAAAAEKMQRVERDILPVAPESARAAEFACNKGATGVPDLLDASRSPGKFRLMLWANKVILRAPGPDGKV